MYIYKYFISYGKKGSSYIHLFSFLLDVCFFLLLLFLFFSVFIFILCVALSMCAMVIVFGLWNVCVSLYVLLLMVVYVGENG